jgi:ATP-binding protein involved in chromosome partitioning
MEVFGAGGGQTVADSLTRTVGASVPLLGQVPLDTRVREAGDSGTPIVLADPGAPAAKALNAVADRLAVRRESLVGKPLTLSVTKR